MLAHRHRRRHRGPVFAHRHRLRRTAQAFVRRRHTLSIRTSLRRRRHRSVVRVLRTSTAMRGKAVIGGGTTGLMSGRRVTGPALARDGTGYLAAGFSRDQDGLTAKGIGRGTRCRVSRETSIWKVMGLKKTTGRDVAAAEAALRAGDQKSRAHSGNDHAGRLCGVSPRSTRIERR